MRATRYTDQQLKMPPGKPLPREVVGDFELWIRNGAPLPADSPSLPSTGHTLWSLQKPRHSAQSADLDAFIREKLHARGLTQSPEADKRTLIRRVTFDL